MEEELGNLALGNGSLTLIPRFCCWVISWLPAVYLAINRIHCITQELWVVGSSPHGAVDSVCWCWRIGCSCEKSPRLRNVLLTKVCQSPGAPCIRV